MLALVQIIGDGTDPVFYLCIHLCGRTSLIEGGKGGGLQVDLSSGKLSFSAAVRRDKKEPAQTRHHRISRNLTESLLPSKCAVFTFFFVHTLR